MATGTAGLPARELEFGGRLQHLAGRANPAFAVGAVVVPLALLGVAVALNDLRALFYVHVASGAVWFSVAIIFPAVLGPTLGTLDEEAAGAFTGTFIPKVAFFVFGVSTTTVVSGTVMADWLGLLGTGDVWVQAALGLGWGLWVFGLLVPNRLHLKAYYEGQSGSPDVSVMERVEKWNLVTGLFDAAAMLAVVFVMTNLRF